MIIEIINIRIINIILDISQILIIKMDIEIIIIIDII